MADQEVLSVIEWCKRQKETEASRSEFFTSQGVKAMLQMPDGATQDITEGVITNQRENAAMMDRIIAILQRNSA